MLREREREEKLAEKRRQANLKVWEKHSDRTRRYQPSRILNMRTPRQRDLARAKPDRVFQGHRREKENMAEFISKKREMFLTQMSLDTKREEIKKLEEKIAMKEDALKKSETLLETDAVRFGKFLRDNDKKAHSALKEADLKTQEKQLKALEIKRLNQDIAKIDADIAKYEEMKKRNLEYKYFLDKLSPQDFKDAREAKRLERRAKLTAQGVPDDEQSSSDEECFFKEPSELLELFTQLEFRCLVLIEKSQESEEGLEELRNQRKFTEASMREKTTDMETNINELKTKYAEEIAKQEALKRRTEMSVGGQQLRTFLDELEKKVASVYHRVGFQESNVDSLTMLRELEGWLEYLVSQLTKFAEQDENEKKSRIDEMANQRILTRREDNRAGKRAEASQKNEDRLRKASDRGNMQVVRRTGRAVMFRSPPPMKKKKKETIVETDDEREQLVKFFT
jgi:hypothetical protein